MDSFAYGYAFHCGQCMHVDICISIATVHAHMQYIYIYWYGIAIILCANHAYIADSHIICNIT